MFVTPPNVLQLYELSAASSSICQIIFICHSMSTLYQYEDVINNQLYDGTGINCKLDQLQSKLRRHYAKTIGGRLDSSSPSITRPFLFFAKSSGLIQFYNRKLKELCLSFSTPFCETLRANYAGKLNLRLAIGNRKCQNYKCCAYAPCVCW